MFYFIGANGYANSTSINIYLKLEPQNKVALLVNEFNQFLASSGLIKRYHLEPFITKHPLHVTLFLADYDKTNVTELINQTKTIAQKQSKLVITTGPFSGNAKSYVMLSVTNSKELQLLSNKMIYAFSNLRDKNAKIPQWARDNPQRRALFKTFGSPNVFQYFNPHFSVMEPVHLSGNQIKHLTRELQPLIIRFNKNKSKPIEAVAYGIGVGEADSQGQIIRELAWFHLK